MAAAALGCGLDREDYYRGALQVAGAAGASGPALDGMVAAGAPEIAAGSGGATGTDEGAGAYRSLDLSLETGGLTYTMLVSRPRAVADDAPLPLVLAFHGEASASWSTAESLRQALGLEDEAAGAAMFVYPRALSDAWPFFSDAVRAEGVALVAALLDATEARFAFDRERVFLVGWDIGAYFANAMACRLPAGTVRGVAAHSGKLYSVDTPSGAKDFGETASGQTTCNLPSALLIWGLSEPVSEYDLTQTYYRETLRCAATTSPWPPQPPCVSHDSCDQPLIWCGIEGLGHALWPGAGRAIWRFIDGLR